MLYKVIESKLKSTTGGKSLKELTLKGEGQDHLEPRTTIWEDHPDFAKAEVGADIKGTLEKKDSGTPIPAHPEKNYINRTLLAEMNENGTEKNNNPDEMLLVHERLARIEKVVFKKKEDTIEYPEEDTKPEDIPFN